jgi:hypothetical protein
MSIAEDRYTNLRVQNNLVVQDLVIHGNLDVALSQLHAHSFGEFRTTPNDSVAYYLIIDQSGTYMELGSLDTLDNEPTIISQKTIHGTDRSPENILYSDMHYDHFISAEFYYRFTSDRDVLLLYHTMNSNIQCTPLYEINALTTSSTRELDFVFDMDITDRTNIFNKNLFMI